MIDISLLSDAVSVLSEIGGGIVRLSSLPSERRSHYHSIVDETFTVLDHALLCVIQRLSDCMRIHSEYGANAFMIDVRALQSVNDWEKLERDVRLCHSLRKAGGEMRHLMSNLNDRISLSDMNKFWQLVNVVVKGETTLDNQIANMLYQLSHISDAEIALDEITSCLKELKNLRSVLIASQVDIMRQI